MVIGIKFCGHCNPRLDVWELFQQLRLAMPDATFHFYIHDPNPDVLVLLNGCHVACCSRPPFSGPIISVSPGEINNQTVAPETLLAELVQTISGCVLRD